ncbi:MAG: hypothetical protein WBB34_08855 [Xanthobacteraceae bacterium]
MAGPLRHRRQCARKRSESAKIKVTAVNYRAGVLAIQFFGTHAEYHDIDAETV